MIGGKVGEWKRFGKEGVVKIERMMERKEGSRGKERGEGRFFVFVGGVVFY